MSTQVKLLFFGGGGGGVGKAANTRTEALKTFALSSGFSQPLGRQVFAKWVAEPLTYVVPTLLHLVGGGKATPQTSLIAASFISCLYPTRFFGAHF